MHVRHSLRCRPRNIVGVGDFKMQFCPVGKPDAARRLGHQSTPKTYPAYDLAALPTRSDEIPRAGSDFAAGDVAHGGAIAAVRCPARETRVESVTQSQGRAGGLIDATQRLGDESVAVLQQVGADLAAGPRQLVERIQIQLSRQLRDDAGRCVRDGVVRQPDCRWVSRREDVAGGPCFDGLQDEVQRVGP